MYFAEKQARYTFARLTQIHPVHFFERYEATSRHHLEALAEIEYELTSWRKREDDTGREIMVVGPEAEVVEGVQDAYNRLVASKIYELHLASLPILPRIPSHWERISVPTAEILVQAVQKTWGGLSLLGYELRINNHAGQIASNVLYFIQMMASIYFTYLQGSGAEFETVIRGAGGAVLSTLVFL